MYVPRCISYSIGYRFAADHVCEGLGLHLQDNSLLQEFKNLSGWNFMDQSRAGVLLSDSAPPAELGGKKIPHQFLDHNMLSGCIPQNLHSQTSRLPRNWTYMYLDESVAAQATEYCCRSASCTFQRHLRLGRHFQCAFLQEFGEVRMLWSQEQGHLLHPSSDYAG